MKINEYLIYINRTRRVHYVFLFTSSYTSRNLVRCHTFPVNVIYAWYINCYCPRPDLKRIPPGFYNKKCNKIFTKLGDLLQTFHCPIVLMFTADQIRLVFPRESFRFNIIFTVFTQLSLNARFITTSKSNSEWNGSPKL